MATDTLQTPQEALSTLQSAPHTFLQPTPQLHATFLQLAKHFLDPLATNVTAAQDARQQALRQDRKRKRKATAEDVGPLLKMRKIHVHGFDVSQVWQQARRVLDATNDEVERDMPAEEDEDTEDGGLGLDDGNKPRKAVRFEEDGLEIGESDDEALDDDDDNSLGEEGVDWEYEGDDAAEDGEMDGDMDGGSEGELLDSDISEEEDEAPKNAKPLVKDKFGLNDGFFSIDDFNKQSQFLEDADAEGRDDGAASDEEDVDWEADPLMGGPQPQSESTKVKGVNADDEEAQEKEDEEGGPTFGNMDLDAPEGDSDLDDDDQDLDEDMDAMGMSNTNDVTYADFFEPPAQAAGKKKPRRSKLALATENDEGPNDPDMERAISSVHRDLFADELSEEDDPDAERDPQDAPSNKNLSTHERRQLALRTEIRRLEAANVAPKDWTLTGESLAPVRPVNSLLEEDLDFERAGKPVPVVTQAVNEDIEALIKRRINNREFDEVVRRRPTDLVTGQQKRRGMAELSDSKPTKGLAEEYADEHLRQTDPNYVDERSEAVKAKHADIEKHYAAVCRDLDILSNLHYKPKPAASSMDIRVDVPKIAMEEARPSVAGAGVEDSVLAPQEMYKAGEDGRQQGEVMTRGGTAVSKEEQTREQKKRRRRREKERTKKANGNVAPATNGTTGKGEAPKSRREKKDDVVRQLDKGGVKVIGKGGELKDVGGRNFQEKTQRAAVGNFRL